MRNETSSGTPQVESRTIVLRIAAITVAYFLASEVFVDELVLRVYRVSHGSPYHIAIHGALIGVTGMLGWWLVIRPIQRVASSEQFLGALHRGLEMADTSIEALAVFGRALGLLGPREVVPASPRRLEPGAPGRGIGDLARAWVGLLG